MAGTLMWNKIGSLENTGVWRTEMHLEKSNKVARIQCSSTESSNVHTKRYIHRKFYSVHIFRDSKYGQRTDCTEKCQQINQQSEDAKTNFINTNSWCVNLL